MKFQAYRASDGQYRSRFVDADGTTVAIKVGSIAAAGRARHPKIERAVTAALKRLAEADDELARSQ